MEFQLNPQKRITLSVLGANGTWQGEKQLPGLISYRVGRDPSRWAENVPTFERLRRQGVLPGIDWLVYSNGGSLEYDFELADANLLPTLLIKIEGADTLLPNGELLASGKDYSWRQRAPRFFTSSGAEIPGGLARVSSQTYRFVLQTPAPTGPLRIDPVVDMAGRFGTPGKERTIFANDSIVYGNTGQSTWDHSPSGSGTDIFLRTHGSGSAYHTLIWGGSGDDVLNAPGAGWTSSQDLPPNPSSTQQSLGNFGGGSRDGLQLHVSDASISYTLFAGPGDEELHECVVISSFSTACVGASTSPNSATSDAALWIRHYATTRFWSFGGLGQDLWRRVHWDPLSPGDSAPGVLYFAGETQSEDLQNLDAPWSARRGGRDLWMGAFGVSFTAAPSLNNLWQGLWGGPSDESLAGLSFFRHRGIVLSGTTNSNNIEHTNAAQAGFGGGESDGFLLMVDTNGAGILRSTYLGGNGDDRVHSATPFTGGLLLAGSTTSTDWSLPGSSLQSNLPPPDASNPDGFVALASLRGGIEWASRFGGPGKDSAAYVSVSSSGIWIAGESSDLSWLPSLNPILSLTPPRLPFSESNQSSGEDDSFYFRFRENFAGVDAVRVGKNLRSPIPLVTMLSPVFDGRVELLSSDPSKFLIAEDDAGVENSLSEAVPHAVLFNVTPTVAPSLPRRIFIDALEEGEAELIVRITGMPERRFPVTIVPSLVYPKELSVYHPLNTVLTYEAILSPQPLPGEQPVARWARFGLNPEVDFVPSDPTALTMLPLDAAERGITLFFGGRQRADLRREGVFELTPRSPHFPTAPSASVSVRSSREVPRTTIPRPLLAMQGLTWLFTIPPDAPAGPLELSSLDPSLLLLSTSNSERGQATVQLGSNRPLIYCQPLGANAKTAIRLSSPSGWSFDQEVILAPTRVELSVSTAVSSPLNFATVQANFSPLLPKENFETSPALRPTLAQLAPIARLPLSPSIGIASATPALASLQELSWAGLTLSARFFLTVPGTASFSLEAPDYFLREGPSTLSVEILPSAIRPLRSVIRLPEGARAEFRATVDLPPAQRSAVAVAFSRSGVATFQQLTQSTAQTLDFTEFKPTIYLAASGKAGDTTTATLSSGTTRAEIEIRIVPSRLVPFYEEIQVERNAYPHFRVLPQDPADASPGERFTLARPSDFALRFDPPGVCEVPSTLSLSPSVDGISISCPTPGIADLEVKALSGLTPDSTSTLRIQSGPNPLQTLPSSSNPSPADSYRLILGAGLQSAVSLESANVPVGDIVVESTDPSLFTISADAATPGQPVWQGQYRPGVLQALFIQASSRTGSATLRISSPRGLIRTLTVFVWPASLVFSPNGPFRRQPTTVLAYAGAEPVAGSAQFQLLPIDPATRHPYRPGNRVYSPSPSLIGETFIRASSSHPELLEILTPTPVLGRGPLNISFRMLGPGDASIELPQPPGFEKSPQSTLLVQSRTPKLRLASPLIFARGVIKSTYPVSDESSAGGFWRVPVTVTSTNPNAIVLRNGPDGPPLDRITLSGNISLWISCLEELPASLRLEAPGIPPQEFEVQYEPLAVFNESSFHPPLLPNETSGVSWRIDFLHASARLLAGGALLGSQHPYRFQASSNNPEVLSLPNGPEPRLLNNSPYLALTVRSGLPGKALISLESTGLPLPLPPPLEITVTPFPIDVLSRFSLSRGLVSQMEVRSFKNEWRTYRVASRNGQILLGDSPQSLSAGPLEVLVPPQNSTNIFIASPLSPVSDSLVWTAPLSSEATTILEFTTPQFRFNTSQGNSLVANLEAGTLPIRIDLLGSSSPQLGLSPSAAPQTLRLVSSNPQILSVDSPDLVFGANQPSLPVTLRLRSRGSVILTLEPPAGFNVGQDKPELLITVR